MSELPHNFASNNGPHRQAGISLFEILVTLVVVSIALLSLAHLQGHALRFVADSKFRTHATLHAADLADRMRANVFAADDYAVSDPGGTCDPLAVTVTGELNCWHRSLTESLPGGIGNVTSDGAGQYTIEVSWLERPAGLTGSTTATRRSISWTVDLL